MNAPDYTIRVPDLNREEFYVAVNGQECRGRCNTWFSTTVDCMTLLAQNQRDFEVQTATGIEKVNAAEFLLALETPQKEQKPSGSRDKKSDEESRVERERK